MGAVMGAFYASGYSSAAIEKIVRSIDWQRVFERKPDRALVPLSERLGETPPLVSIGYDYFRISLPQGAFSDYAINRTLAQYLAAPGFVAERDFSRLPIPFRAVTADLRTGERVVQAAGSLPRAVRASMSIPVAFAPVVLDGRLLVDGGIVDNLPISAACEMGADVVIAVDVTSPPLSAEKYLSLLAVASQVTNVLAATANRNHEDRANVLIQPELENHGFADYSRFDELIQAGYDAATAAMPRIKELVSGSRQARREPAPTGLALENRTLTGVRVEGNSRVKTESIQWDATLRPPEPFRLDRVLRAMDLVYASGLFETCWLDLVPDGPEGVVAVIHVRELPRGTFELGLSYNDDDEIHALVRFKHRNLLGVGDRAQLVADASDSRNGVRFSLGRDRSVARSRLGFRVDASVEEQKPKVYRERDYVGRAEFDRKGLAASGLFEVSRPGLLSLTLRAENVETVDSPGLAGLVTRPGTDALRALALSFTWDDLDDPSLPRRGSRLTFSHEENRRAFGATTDFRKTAASFRFAKRFAGTSLVEADLTLGFSEGGLPPYEQFRLGGPGLLPGYARDSRWGDQVAALSATYSFIVFPKLRLRARAGTGNVWARAGDVTLRGMRYGVGGGALYETPVGPLMADFGVSDTGATRLYFAVGFQ